MTDHFDGRLRAAWRRSDELFAMIGDDALLAQPIPLRQPFLFYVGHLPAFAWNQMVRGVLGQPSFNPEYDQLFEFGIDPLDVERHEAQVRWPEPEQVIAYRDAVRERVLAALPETLARGDADELTARGRIVNLVLEHELMHHETLLYMLQELGLEHKHPPQGLAPPATAGAARRETVEVEEGAVTLGASFAEADFGWDNEFERHEVRVPAFRIDSTAVRNGEFLEFVAAGGYERPELWRDEEWAWRERQQIRFPRFWRAAGDGYAFRTLFRELPLGDVADWPVPVSWAEADAYARWRGGRLPTEAEVHRAAYAEPGGGQRTYPWGADEPDRGRANVGFDRWELVPVGSLARGASAWGVHDLIGNGWEWTSTVFAPYPGFRPWAHTYPGYSQSFFDGRHYVMLGGSWATDRALLRPSFRNWFQPHYPYVFAQFRVVK